MKSLKERLGNINRYKDITVGDMALKVYMPTASHMKHILDTIDNPPQEQVQAQYDKFAKIMPTLVEAGHAREENGEFILVSDGRDMPLTLLAKVKAQDELFITAMMSLVGFQEGDEIFALDYQEVLDTLSEQQIKQYVQMIKAEICPDYKTVLGN